MIVAIAALFATSIPGLIESCDAAKVERLQAVHQAARRLTVKDVGKVLQPGDKVWCETGSAVVWVGNQRHILSPKDHPKSNPLEIPFLIQSRAFGDRVSIMGRRNFEMEPHRIVVAKPLPRTSYPNKPNGPKMRSGGPPPLEYEVQVSGHKYILDADQLKRLKAKHNPRSIDVTGEDSAIVTKLFSAFGNSSSGAQWQLISRGDDWALSERGQQIERQVSAALDLEDESGLLTLGFHNERSFSLAYSSLLPSETIASEAAADDEIRAYNVDTGKPAKAEILRSPELLDGRMLRMMGELQDADKDCEIVFVISRGSDHLYCDAFLLLSSRSEMRLTQGLSGIDAPTPLFGAYERADLYMSFRLFTEAYAELRTAHALAPQSSEVQSRIQRCLDAAGPFLGSVILAQGRS